MTSAITRFRTLLTASAVAAGSVVPIGSASADAHCPSVQVLGIPGTFYYHKPGEPALDPSRPGAMISQVAGMLAAERAQGRIGYEQVAHPADIGAVVSYRQSNAIGVALTKQRVSAIAATCPGTRFAIVGYSNGAGVAGDVLRDIGAGKGPVGADRIAGGFLISDPRRAPGDNLVGPPVRGVGVDLPRPGGFGAVGDRTYTFCAAGDLVCDNEPNATLLRPLMQRFATTANVSFVTAVMRAILQNGLDLKKWARFVDEPNELSLLAKVTTTLQRLESYSRLDNHAYYNDLRLNIGGRTVTQWVADKIRDPAGVSIPAASPSQPNRQPASVDPAITGFSQFQQAVRAITGGATVRQTVPREKLTRLLLEQDPSLTPAVISKAVAALADVADIVLAVDPYQLSRLASGIAQASAGAAQLGAGVVSPDAVLKTVCGSGLATAAGLAIFADVVRRYEASTNLPQIADMLDLLDPTSADGARVFAALPPQARTPEVLAALTSLARIGKALNSLDKQRIIGLARMYAELVASCDLRSLLALPGLLVQTIAVGTEVIKALTTNLGGQGAALRAAAAKAAHTPKAKAMVTKARKPVTKARPPAPIRTRAATTKVAIGGGSGIVFGHGGPVTESRYWMCTMTTVGRDRAGNLIGLTNAHCFYDNEGHQWLGDKVYRDKSTPGTSTRPSQRTEPDLDTGVIGTVAYISGGNPVAPGPNGVGLDYAVIRLDETKVEPAATVGEVTISRIGPPPGPGTVMCKQGRSSGLTCGTKLVDIGNYFSDTIWEVGGDSGSPVAVGQTLVGNQWVAGGSTSMVAIINDLDTRGGLGAGFRPVTPR